MMKAKVEPKEERQPPLKRMKVEAKEDSPPEQLKLKRVRVEHEEGQQPPLKQEKVEAKEEPPPKHLQAVCEFYAPPLLYVLPGPSQLDLNRGINHIIKHEQKYCTVEMCCPQFVMPHDFANMADDDLL